MIFFLDNYISYDILYVEVKIKIFDITGCHDPRNERGLKTISSAVARAEKEKTMENNYREAYFTLQGRYQVQGEKLASEQKVISELQDKIKTLEDNNLLQFRTILDYKEKVSKRNLQIADLKKEYGKLQEFVRKELDKMQEKNITMRKSLKIYSHEKEMFRCEKMDFKKQIAELQEKLTASYNLGLTPEELTGKINPMLDV